MNNISALPLFSSLPTRLLPSLLPKTPCSSVGDERGSSSVFGLSSLTALQSYHPDLTIHLLPSPSITVCVCLFVCVSVLDLELPVCVACFPSNRPWKLCSLSAAAAISCSKMSVWSCVIEKRSERERQEVCFTFSSVYCGWCIWRQLLTALQPFEPHIKGWQNGGHCVVIWSVEISCCHQTWTITHLKFKKKFVKSLFSHYYWRSNHWKINYSLKQHSKTEYSSTASDLSRFKVHVFSTQTGTNSTPHLHDAKLSHLSAAARTAGS